MILHLYLANVYLMIKLLETLDTQFVHLVDAMTRAMVQIIGFICHLLGCIYNLVRNIERYLLVFDVVTC